MRSRVAVAGARVLPVVELLVAGALLVRITSWWGAVASLALFTVFAAAIGRAMARGEAPACHCFGQLHSRPAGKGTLARNAALAALSGVVLATGPSGQGSALGWIAGLHGVEIALAFAVVGLGAVCSAGGWFLFELLRQNGRILARLDALEEPVAVRGAAGVPPAGPGVNGHARHVGLPLGVMAPGFTLPSAGGGVGGLSGLLERARPVLLVFSDPACGPCNALTPEIAEWQQEHRERLTVAVVSSGTVELNAARAQGHGLSDVFLEVDHEIAQSFDAHGTPSAVLIGIDGTVQSPLAAGGNAIRALVARAVAPGLELVQMRAALARPPASPPVRGRSQLSPPANLGGGLR